MLGAAGVGRHKAVWIFYPPIVVLTGLHSVKRLSLRHRTICRRICRISWRMCLC